MGCFCPMTAFAAALFATIIIIRCNMNDKNKAKFKKIITGVAAVATTFALALAPSCANNETSTEEEDENTRTRQDTQTIKNGNFEFYDDNDGIYFISPADNWTGGTTGNSSSSMSGIIDTSKKTWDYMTDPSLPATLENNDDLEADDENKKDYNGALTDDLPFSDPHEATASDAVTDDYKYIDNPFTHKYNYNAEGKVTDLDGNVVTTYEDEDGNLYLDEAHTTPVETSVLMLHNYRKSYLTGTESYYTSSTTVTLEASTAAEISVWVKTSDLYFGGSDNTRTAVKGERGAYIKVDTTIGGNTLDSFKIKNIDTSILNPKPADGGKWQDNGWVEYTIYVEATSFASTNVTITLGLGEDDIYTVEGYAFFDDVSLTKYKNSDLLKQAVEEDGEDFDALITEDNTCSLLDPDGKSTFRVDKEVVQTNDGDNAVEHVNDNNFNDRAFFIDLASYTSKTPVVLDSTSVSAGLTVEKTNTGSYVSSKNGVTTTNIGVLDNGAGNAYLPTKLKENNGLNTAEDLLATLSITDDENWSTSLGGNYASALTDALKSAATLPGADGNTNAIVMLSTYGASYQAEIVNNDIFTLDKDQYVLVSFWVKTSDTESGSTPTITVRDSNDDNNYGSFSIDSTDVATVKINDEEDVYDGWVQCFVRVANNTEEKSSFKIVVNYGPTTIQGTSVSSYKSGWIAVSNMAITSLDEDVYSYTSSGSYLASLSLSEDDDNSSFYFDDEQGNKGEIKNDIAIPESYSGVNGASADVNVNAAEDSEYNESNRNDLAGLINKEYLSEYKTQKRTWYSAIAALYNINENATDDEIWNIIAGPYSVQPLLIVNTVREIADKTDGIYNYGFIGSNSSVSASGYTAISVRVKVSRGAIANVYLVDTDPSSKQVLSYEIPEYTFWYDDDGNVLKGEPKENASVDELRANIAYRLRTDGLYENGDGKLYANLYNLDIYYDSEFEHESFYDADGKAVNFNDLVQGEIYYANAEKTAYAPHYLIAGENTAKVYKYNAGLGDDATYLYMTDGVADENKVVNGFDTTLATLRYDGKTMADNPYQFTIDARENNSPYADKWVTVTFYVHGGSKSTSYKLELWSGYRDEEQTEDVQDGSFVVFDKSSISVTETTYNSMLSYYTNAIIDDYKNSLDVTLPDNDGNIADYEKLAGEKSNKFNYTATYYTYTLYDSATYVPFNGETAEDGEEGYAYSYSDYDESLAFLKVEDDTMGGGEIMMSAFIDYSAVDKAVELSGSTDVEEDTTEETTPESDSNVWLLAASIAIVIAILIAIISIVIRDIVKRNRRNKKSAGKNSFNFNKNKRYVKKYVKANGEAPVKEENVDASLLEDAPATPAEDVKSDAEAEDTATKDGGVTTTDAAEGTDDGEDGKTE